MNVLLLVEDSDEIRAIYGGSLRRAGFVVAEATTLDRAFAVVPEVGPDLIVLDRDLPDGDGLDLARSLRASSDDEYIPIVAFTSHTHPREIEVAHSAGCDAFVGKPSAPFKLVEKVRQVLNVPEEPVRRFG